MKETMKAYVLEGPGRLCFKDVPVPTFPLFPQERPFIFQLGLSFYCKARIRTSISFSFFNPSFTSLIFVSP